MAWPNEFQWFLLFLLIMKVILFWAVATWVVAVTADRPCAEYCVYLSSGARDIEFQTGCDCLYNEAEYENQFDDTSIYYEPIDYIPLPVNIHNHPIYILNPMSESNTYPTNNNRVTPETVQPLHSRTFDTARELNAENTHLTVNRHEKDIKSNKKTQDSPIYLDIDVKSEDVQRSSSKSFTVQDLKLTEQSLLECARLHAALHSREKSETKDQRASKYYLPDEYINLSQAELKQLIQNKCTHISYIVEESLDEIKKTRSKLSSIKFRMDGDVQQNNKEPNRNNIHNPTENTDCTNISENSSPSSIQGEYSENQEHTTVIFTESDVKTPANLKTIPNHLNTTVNTEISSTVAATSVGDIQSSSDNNFTAQDDTKEVSSTSTENQNTTPIYTENEITSLRPTTSPEPSTSSADLTVTNIVEQENLEGQHTDQNSNIADVEQRRKNRTHYQEGEVPLVKIITQEFSNNTVKSIINGTEDIPNGDFNDQLNQKQAERSAPIESKTNIRDVEGYGIIEPDISGNLYFIFNKQQIPAKFVQTSNGSLYLGIDGVTLCDKLTQNDEHNSVLLTNLCKCYENGNCTRKNSN